MHNFKELKVWQKGRLRVKDIYLTTAKFPQNEKFGIISQIQRAAVSICLNIAEGAGRRTNDDFCKFLDMALGSTNEVETLIFLSFDLQFIDEKKQNELMEKTNEIQKMIAALIDNFRK